VEDDEKKGSYGDQEVDELLRESPGMGMQEKEGKGTTISAKT